MGGEPRIVQVDDEAAVIEKLCALVEAKAKVPGPTLNVGKLFFLHFLGEERGIRTWFLKLYAVHR